LADTQSTDSEPSTTAEAPSPARAARLRLRGRGLIGASVVLVIAFVLTIADAGYGHNPHREFGQRRSYNMVKEGVHGALPGALPYLLGAGVLFALGYWTLRRANR
jgi:hypothetical protein